jgi:phage terminase large subunit-like protein
MTSSFAAQLADALENCWPAIARSNQLPPPGDRWQIWLLLAGRAFGKEMTGAADQRSFVGRAEPT